MIPVIFQVISVLPFIAKNAFVTGYLLESSLARFKNVVCCSNYFVFAKLQRGKRINYWSPQPLVYFLPYEREQEAHKCIHLKHFRVNSIKISNVVTKVWKFPNIVSGTVALTDQFANEFIQSSRGLIQWCSQYRLSWNASRLYFELIYC